MGSYVTGLLIALCLVFGLYMSCELTTGNTVFAQERLVEQTEDELRTIAADYESEDQVEAIIQLGDRPGDLSKTVIVLARLSLSPKEVVKMAADASLEAIGEPAAEHLKPLVDDDTEDGLRNACSAIRAIGPACKIYLPQIQRLLADDQTMYRKFGLYALQGIGPEGKVAMAEVIACLGDKDMNTQCSACRVLETFGADAIEAEPELLKLLEEGGPSTRGWAAVCLGAIGPTSSDVDVAQLLADHLTFERNGRPVIMTPIEQERILIGLAHLGPDAAKVVDVVHKKMHGANLHVASHAAYAHWRITGDTKEAVATLKKVIDDPMHQEEGIVVAGKMGEAGQELSGVLARTMRSAEPGTREMSVLSLSKMGEAAKPYAKEIEDRLSDTDPLVRLSARRAMAELKRFEDESKASAESAAETVK